MKKYFLKDKSLNNIDDDLFRYQDFANNLRKLIEHNEVPFNIAVIGKWGLGKSSIVNMALAPLRKKDRNKEFLICDINAWKYEKDEIGKAFLKELWEGISERNVLSFNFFHKDYSDTVKEMLKDENSTSRKNAGLHKFLKFVVIAIVLSIIAFIIYCYFSNGFYGVAFQGTQFWVSTFLRYCKNMGSILIIPLVVWLGKLFMDKLNEPAYKNYEISFPLQTQADYEMYLKNLLQEYYKINPEKRIIVVIDDLDRLSAEKIVEALDALKLFMEYDRFIFIVPFDDEILKNALRSKRINGISTFGNEYDGEMVLDKIFQYKMYLPQLIKYDMRNYAFEICKNDCSDFIREYCNDNYELFEEIVGKILIHSGVSTPRQVKKIINAFVENVMIARDREQAEKVAEGFAAEKIGLQTIAKISVLQSDYNEFYDLLFKDANVINEILEVHRSNGEKESPKLLKNYFDDKNVLKKKYEPLVNYLIFTENLGHNNITPYLYMSQTKEGVLVGDQKQQDFMAAIESCNFVSVKQLIGETPILISLFIEQLRYNESPMMGNIVLSAIDCYDAISEDDREKLAFSIAERIPELSSSLCDFRYDLINEKNLVAVCHKVNDDGYNGLVECALNRNQQDGNYKNRVILINKISRIKYELLEEVLNKFEIYTKEWMISDESGVQDVIDYAAGEEINYFANVYGKEYVKKIAKHITDNDDFDDTMIKQFGNVLSAFLENNSIMEIADVLEPCYEYPILHKMLDASISEMEYKEIQNAKDIAIKIASVGVKNLKGIYGYRILSKLSYTVNAEEGKNMDVFFSDTVGEIEFSDMIETFSNNNTLDMLPQTIGRLNEYAFEEEGYASDVRRLLKRYTKEQTYTFWNNLDNLCRYSSGREYKIISDLIVDLSKDDHYDKEAINVIEKDIISGAANYYNQDNYLLFAIQVVSAYKDKISQSVLDKYSTVLLKVIATDTDNALNAYRVVNKLNSKEFWCKNIGTVLGYVTKGTYAVIYDIITGRIELFNKENDNLTQLVDFLVDYIDLSTNPDDVINILNAQFSKIGKVAQLVHKLMNIEYDEDNASTKLTKFIDNCEVSVIIKIISDEWGKDDIHKEKLVKILSKSEKYSVQALLYRINENKESISKNDLISLLEFCESDVTENNIESLVNIMRYLLENYFEKDICTQILVQISNLTHIVIAKQRENLCMILTEIFQKSSSEENKRKCAVIIKDKGFGRKMKGKLDESELKEYRSYLS